MHPDPLPRRRFLRTAAIGGGAVALAGLSAPPANASESTTTGTIELSAIPLTYVSAPLNLQGEIFWSVRKQRTNTFSLTSVENRSTSLSVDRSLVLSGFSAGDRTFRQSGSGTEETTAVVVSSDDHLQVNVRAQNGTSGYATVSDTAFLLLQKPKVFLDGNLSGFKWKFLNANSFMVSTVRALEDPADPFGHQALLGAQTAAAVRGIYPLSAANSSGRALGLAKPRYKFRGQIIVPPSSAPTSFDRTTTSGTTLSIKTRSTMVTTITKRDGFSGGIPGIITIQSMFEEGKSIEISTIGVQENTDVKMQTTGGSRLWNDQVGRFTWLYWDRLWKTLLLTDEGPINAGTTMVAGTVFDSSGTPVPGAYVALGDGTVTYEALSDGAGQYRVATPTRLSAGGYTVFSGDGASSVNIGSTGTATAHIEVFNPGSTRTPPSPYGPFLE